MFSSLKQNWPIVCRFWQFVYVGFTYSQGFLYTIDVNLPIGMRFPRRCGMSDECSVPNGGRCQRKHPQPLGCGQTPVLFDV